MMRLVGIELRNYRCFEYLEVDLDETTVIVGANDTGKSAILEAIDELLAPGALDWGEVKRVGASGPAAIVGRFRDFVVEDPFSLAAFMDNDTIRIGLTSDTGRDWWLVVTPAQAQVVKDALASELVRDALEAGTVEPGFEDGVVIESTLGTEVWYPWWIWEFVDQWGILGGWESDSLASMQAIRLGSSGDTGWDPAAVLRPIILRQFGGDIDNEVFRTMEALEDQVDDLLGRMSRGVSQALGGSSPYRWIRWHTEAGLVDQVIEALVADLSLDPTGPPGVREVEALPVGPNRRLQLMLALSRSPTPTLGDLGPGTQRSVALAALELYRDPNLWPLGGTAVLLVEEPETGLHPEAQRRAAAQLRTLATYGLQLVVVTHSPAFINAAPPSGIRLALKSLTEDGKSLERTVVRPVGLAELRRELAVTPSDILLARRFVVVEGDSDRAILTAWARRIGVDLEADGIQLVPSGGYSSAERISQFLTLAYAGADFVVVLDNGSQTDKTQREIVARFGDRVRPVVLSRTDIEGFFSISSVAAWLVSAGVNADGLADQVRMRLEAPKGGRIAALESLTHRYLHRAYHKVSDGLAIALATAEADVDAEVVALLTELVAP